MTIEELSNAGKKLRTAEELLLKIDAAKDLIEELKELQKVKSRFFSKGISEYYRDNIRSRDYGYGGNVDRIQILLNEVGTNEIESDALLKILSLVKDKLKQYQKEFEEYEIS